MRIIGIDPGLRITGWGIIDAEGSRLTHVGHGVVTSDDKAALSDRLRTLYDGLYEVVERYQPAGAAVEQTFVNANAMSALKLGHARAVALLVPAQSGLVVAEYEPSLVKKALTGSGRADKAQVAAMVARLLPGIDRDARADAYDALAVAICHAHHGGTRAGWTARAR
ncbi:crossover junction endodeoxyribonuclease RuvC [Tistrella mobilis]|uniref:crossover junction endodeoxyribonuclease RuvC n=1 Tax=Tistrella mobilis TaxID=171437 RepID=UPI0035581753